MNFSNDPHMLGPGEPCKVEVLLPKNDFVHFSGESNVVFVVSNNTQRGVHQCRLFSNFVYPLLLLFNIINCYFSAYSKVCLYFSV